MCVKGGLDEAAHREQAPVVEQRQARAQVQQRDAGCPSGLFRRTHEGARDPATTVARVHRKALHIQSAIPLGPHDRTDQSVTGHRDCTTGEWSGCRSLSEVVVAVAGSDRRCAAASLAGDPNLFAAAPEVGQHIGLAQSQSRGGRIDRRRLQRKSVPHQRGDNGGVRLSHWSQTHGFVHTATVASGAPAAYVAAMSETPAFLDLGRPPVPNLVVPRGVTSFFLPQRPVRGRLVRLGPLADALLTRHDNHPTVTTLAGQALALAAALSTALKFRGSFSLQAKGDGPVSMLLADSTDTGALRGYARADADKLASLLSSAPSPSAEELLGKGYLAFTVDQGPDEGRHQGIVTIEGGNLAEMALHYFRTSEQLRCFVHLACASTPVGWRASALILEKVAGSGGIDPELDDSAQEESWRTATALASTVSDAELLDDELPAERLLYRLFHTEGGGGRQVAGVVLWLPVLAGATRGYPGGVLGRRSRPHERGWRHRHDLRVLQLRFPLSPPGRAWQAHCPTRELSGPARTLSNRTDAPWG